jgi:4-amino-4-deoxy-L-arabinose transferase-like glycosyltransferase
MNLIKKIIILISENKAITLILLVALILRFFKLDFQSLWMDEIYTLNVASSKHSFLQIISEVNLRESYPYLYFFLMNTVFSLFGDTALVARTTSVIFGTLAVWMMYKIGKVLYSKNAGLIAAILLTFNQYAIYHSQEARAYSFYLLGLLCSYYFFIKFIKEKNRRNMSLYAISAGLMLNTNFFSVLNVLSQGFFMVFVLVSLDRNERNAFIKKILIIMGIVLLFFLPNAYKFYLLTQLVAAFIPQASDEALINILKEIIGSSVYLIFIYGILFTFFMIKVFAEKETIKIKEIVLKKLTFSYLIIFSWISFVLIIIIFKSYTGSSIFLSRYFMSLLPAFILAISIALVNIKNSQIRLSILGLLIFFMAFDLIVVKKYYQYPSKTQFREASQLIVDKNKNNEIVYTSLKFWFDYYLGNKKFTVVEKPNLESIINEMMANPKTIKPFWYTDAHGRPFQLSENAQQFVNNNFYIDENFDGFDAWTKHFILLKDVKKDVDISKFGILKDFNGTPFKFNLEVFENTNNVLTASGWAYFDEQDAAESKINLVLIKDGKATIIQSQRVNRPDVTSYFKSSFNLSNSGFTTTFNLKDLPSGIYKLGVLMEDKTRNKFGLNLTDKTIVK